MRKPWLLNKTLVPSILFLAGGIGVHNHVLADETTNAQRLTFGTPAGPTDETTHDGIAQHAEGSKCESTVDGYVVLHHTATIWPAPGIDSALPEVFSCKVNFSDYVLVTGTIAYPRTVCVRAIAWSRSNKPTHRGHVNCVFDSLIGPVSELP